jgi:hypothetical protein
MKKLIILFLIILSCKNKKENITIDKLPKVNNSLKIEDSTKLIQTDNLFDTIPLDDVLLNNHSLYIDESKFNELYKIVDSTKIQPWECGNPLEWLDEDWMYKKYGKSSDPREKFIKYNGTLKAIYSNKIIFNSNGHKVLFEYAELDRNSIKIKPFNIVFNSELTIDSFQKLFPMKEKEVRELKNECKYRFQLNNEHDDAFFFIFKDGKLKAFELWWLLC